MRWVGDLEGGEKFGLVMLRRWDESEQSYPGGGLGFEVVSHLGGLIRDVEVLNGVCLLARVLQWPVSVLILRLEDKGCRDKQVSGEHLAFNRREFFIHLLFLLLLLANYLEL